MVTKSTFIHLRIYQLDPLNARRVVYLVGKDAWYDVALRSLLHVGELDMHF